MPEGQKPPAQEGQLSPEELQRRYAESSTEGKRLAARVKQLEDENRNLQLRQQPTPPDPDEAALEEAGIDTGALNRFIARKAMEAGQAGAQQQLRPLYLSSQAHQGIPAELQPKAQTLLASNPDVAETYNTLIAAEKPDQAAKFLTQSVRMHDAEAGMHQENDAAKAKRERDRQNAALPPSQTGRGTTEDEEAEQAVIRRQKLQEYAQQVGGINKDIASEYFRGKIKVIDRMDEPPRVI